MSIAFDWDVKNQAKLTFKMQLFTAVVALNQIMAHFKHFQVKSIFKQHWELHDLYYKDQGSHKLWKHGIPGKSLRKCHALKNHGI